MINNKNIIAIAKRWGFMQFDPINMQITSMLKPKFNITESEEVLTINWQ